MIGPVVVPDGGDTIVLGVRPEDLALAASGIAARVLDSEYLGADTILKCAAGDETLAVRVPGRAPAALGAMVHLTWPPRAVHRFEAATGRRRDDVPLAKEMTWRS